MVMKNKRNELGEPAEAILSIPKKCTVFDRCMLRKSSREIGPSGVPIPIPLSLLLSLPNSSSQDSHQQIRTY